MACVGEVGVLLDLCYGGSIRMFSMKTLELGYVGFGRFIFLRKPYLSRKFQEFTQVILLFQLGYHMPLVGHIHLQNI